MLKLVRVQVYLLYVHVCTFACADLGLCGLGGVTSSSRMHATGVVVMLHILYGAYQCMV